MSLRLRKGRKRSASVIESVIVMDTGRAAVARGPGSGEMGRKKVTVGDADRTAATFRLLRRTNQCIEAMTASESPESEEIEIGKGRRTDIAIVIGRGTESRRRGAQRGLSGGLEEWPRWRMRRTALRMMRVRLAVVVVAMVPGADRERDLRRRMRRTEEAGKESRRLEARDDRSARRQKTLCLSGLDMYFPKKNSGNRKCSNTSCDDIESSMQQQMPMPLLHAANHLWPDSVGSNHVAHTAERAGPLPSSPGMQTNVLP
jgi:hypothetical protein